jgi:hypothetical protein
MRAVVATCILLLTASAAVAAASKPEILVELERDRIYEGESVVYQVTLNHVENPRDPELKGFDDFDIASLGQQSLDSTQITIINGQRSEIIRRGRVYNYRLTPRKTGLLQIPAPVVTIDGETLYGRSVQLQVKSPEEQDLVRMQITADRETVYPMQPFRVGLTITAKGLPEPHERQNPVALPLPRAPMLSIPWVHDQQLPGGLQAQVAVQEWLGPLENPRAGFSIDGVGRASVFSLFEQRGATFLPESRRVRLPDKSGTPVDYWEYKFQRTFVPKRIEQYTFGPVTLKGTFAAGVEPGRGVIVEDIYAVAKPITVTVKDVPEEGRPEWYTGAVGRFEFSANLEPHKAKAGDPMTLTLALKGEGTLESTAAPDLAKIAEIAANFKLYDASEQTKGALRQFTYSLRPLSAAVKEFPAVPISYFDVQRERYVTLHSEPIPLEIVQADQLANQDIVASPRAAGTGHKELGVSREGIFANITDLSQLGNDAIHPERWAAGLGGMAALYAGLALVVARVRRRGEDKSSVRRRAAAGQARHRMHAARAEFAAERLREGADQVQAALLGLVADVADMPAAGLTRRDALERLAALNVDEEVTRQLGDFLETCEAVRYGASHATRAELSDQADIVLKDLLGALKRQKLLR